MRNIGEVLKGNGLTFDDVSNAPHARGHVKMGVFNKVYVTYFKPENLPARPR